MIVCSDGATRSGPASKILPFLKKAKFKLVKTKDNEFQVQFRDRGERFFFDINLSRWGEIAWEHLSADEQASAYTMTGLFNREPTHEETEKWLARLADEAADIRELIAQGQFTLKAVPNEFLNEIGAYPSEDFSTSTELFSEAAKSDWYVEHAKSEFQRALDDWSSLGHDERGEANACGARVWVAGGHQRSAVLDAPP